nr:MAG TPA: hypothetical protein [Caudoviricetes sp.]
MITQCNNSTRELILSIVSFPLLEIKHFQKGR